MNDNKFEALFTGLTKNGVSQPPQKDSMDNNDHTDNTSNTVNNSNTGNKNKNNNNGDSSNTRNTGDRINEEIKEETRFCTIVEANTLHKIRLIANREGLLIKDVVGAAFNKAIISYEKKHGTIEDNSRNKVDSLF